MVKKRIKGKRTLRGVPLTIKNLKKLRKTVEDYGWRSNVMKRRLWTEVALKIGCLPSTSLGANCKSTYDNHISNREFPEIPKIKS